MLQEALFDFLHPDKPQSKCKLNAGGVSCLLPICYMFDRKMNLHAWTIWFFQEKKEMVWYLILDVIQLNLR